MRAGRGTIPAWSFTRKRACAIDRRAVGLLAAFGVFGVFWGGWAAVLPDIKVGVGASDGVFGLALLGVGIGALPAMLTMGPIYDRYGWRTVPPLLLLFALTTLAPGGAGSALWLFGSLIALGALSGMLDVAINAAAVEWEATTGRRLLSLLHASFSGFFLVASVSVGVARGAGAGPVAILVCLAIVVALAAPLNRAPRPEVVTPKERSRLRLEPFLLMLGGLCALGFVVEGGMEAWSAVHLERTLGSGAAVGGLGPGSFAAAMLSGRALAHFAGHRLSDHGLLMLGALIAAGGISLAALAPTVVLALVGFAFGGLGVAVGAPTLFGIAGREASEQGRGSALGTVTTVGYLGFLFGAPIVGWISGLSSLRFGMGFLAVICLTLAGLSVFIPRAVAKHRSEDRRSLT